MANTGTNLTVWQNAQYFFDPQIEVPILTNTVQFLYIPASVGGYVAGYYQIGSPNLAYSSPGTNANGHNLFVLQPTNIDGSVDTTRASALASNTIATPPQSGASWGYGTTLQAAHDAVTNAAVANYTPPATTPNTAFTGTLRGVILGDSIGQYLGTLPLLKLRAALPNATLNIFDAATPGDTIDMYAPGHSSGRLSAVLNYLNTTTPPSAFAIINLGKNNTKVSSPTAAPAFQDAMKALVNNLFAGCSTLRLVAIDEVSYTLASATNGAFNDASNSLAISYNAGIATISNAVAVTGIYDATSNHAELTASDGVHPATTPAPDGSQPGTGPGYDALAALITHAIAPLLVNLPANQPPPNTTTASADPYRSDNSNTVAVLANFKPDAPSVLVATGLGTFLLPSVHLAYLVPANLPGGKIHFLRRLYQAGTTWAEVGFVAGADANTAPPAAYVDMAVINGVKYEYTAYATPYGDNSVYAN